MRDRALPQLNEEATRRSKRHVERIGETHAHRIGHRRATVHREPQ